MANVSYSSGLEKVKQEYAQFKLLRDTLRTYWNSLTNPQKQAALNTFTNWGSATAVAKADALLAGLALIYITVGFLLFRELGE